MAGGGSIAGGAGYIKNVNTLLDKAESSKGHYAKIDVGTAGKIDVQMVKGSPWFSSTQQRKADLTASTNVVKEMINASFPKTEVISDTGQRMSLADWVMENRSGSSFKLNAKAFREINSLISEGLTKALQDKTTPLSPQSVKQLKDALWLGDRTKDKQDSQRTAAKAQRMLDHGRSAYCGRTKLAETIKADVETQLRALGMDFSDGGATILKIIDDSIGTPVNGLTETFIEESWDKAKAALESEGLDILTNDHPATDRLKSFSDLGRAIKTNAGHAGYLLARTKDNRDLSDVMETTQQQADLVRVLESTDRTMNAVIKYHAESNLRDTQETKLLLGRLQSDMNKVMEQAQVAERTGRKGIANELKLVAGKIYDTAMKLTPMPDRNDLALRPPMTTNPALLDAPAELHNAEALPFNGVRAPNRQVLFSGSNERKTALNDLFQDYNRAIAEVKTAQARFKAEPNGATDANLASLGKALNKARELGDALSTKLDRAESYHTRRSESMGLFGHLFGWSHKQDVHAKTAQNKATQVRSQMSQLKQLNMMVGIANDQRNSPVQMRRTDDKDEAARQQRQANPLQPSVPNTDPQAVGEANKLCRDNFEQSCQVIAGNNNQPVSNVQVSVVDDEILSTSTDSTYLDDLGDQIQQGQFDYLNRIAAGPPKNDVKVIVDDEIDVESTISSDTGIQPESDLESNDDFEQIKIIMNKSISDLESEIDDEIGLGKKPDTPFIDRGADPEQILRDIQDRLDAYYPEYKDEDNATTKIREYVGDVLKGERQFVGSDFKDLVINLEDQDTEARKELDKLRDVNAMRLSDLQSNDEIVRQAEPVVANRTMFLNSVQELLQYEDDVAALVEFSVNAQAAAKSDLGSVVADNKEIVIDKQIVQNDVSAAANDPVINETAGKDGEDGALPGVDTPQ
ncbi:MAG: hypothetical protein AAFS07_13540 [Pseudomonadota bacterium]